MKQYRTEWKYILTEYDLQQVETRLRGLMRPDPHNPDGIYTVHSLYFDDPFNSCAHDNAAGNPRRYKYRIRYYGEEAGFLKLERKERNGDLCRKISIPVDADRYHQLTDPFSGGSSGNTPVSSDPHDNPPDTEFPTIMETDSLSLRFFSEFQSRPFLPKAIIDYERTAFVERTGNVRITLDRNVTVSDRWDHFLDRDYMPLPVMTDGRHILEVKFDDYFPGYLRNALSSVRPVRTSCSKYYSGRLRLQE